MLDRIPVRDLLAYWAHRRAWHRKYLDYRALAEALRVDFYWEVAGVRKEFDGEFAHESFLQKQDVELQWIRNAMRAVSLQLAIRPVRRFQRRLSFRLRELGRRGPSDQPAGADVVLPREARELKHGMHLSERIDRALLFCGLAAGLTFALDVALGTRVVSAARICGTRMLWGLALVPVYAAIFEIYLNEKADRALIRQYRYMFSLFGFAAARAARRRLGSKRSC